MEQQPTNYEFGTGEERKEIIGRLLSIGFGRFARTVINFFIAVINLIKRLVKDILWMLTGRS